MTARKATQSTDTLTPEHILPNLDMLDVDFTTFAVKFAIGYAFIFTGYLAAWNVAVMIALLTSIVWLQYVIAFVVLAALLTGIVVVTPAVTNAVYDAGAFVGSKAKSAFASLRAFASSTKARFAPSTDTVH